ncbi:cache and HAMP domain-containing protein [Skermanella mucosa]|uniref:cache domain-containing protein n=1 Tax=Skermanella mucosa TaxID=1789672 RepID=UPI00192C7DFF|nr:cache and HAMP domain-containing protein [Skermanella mucosa]UEM22033.1 cache and HAMP domain-containing protein [Skermanella mucosa]
MKNPRSLSTLLSVSIAVLCIAPVAGVSLLANGTIGSRLRDQAGAGALDLSAQIADKLDRSMFERWQDIRMIGRIQETLEPDSDPDRLRVKLETLQRSSPEYAWVGLASPEGKVLVSTGRLLEGADVSGRPWFRAGSRNMFAGDVHEALLLAKKLPPNADGDPLRFVDVSMPLRRADGVPLGVLGAHLSWSWGEEITASVLAVRGDRSESVEALIVSAEGDVLMGPDGLVGGKLDLLSLGAARQGGTRYGLETWPDGRDYLTATTLTAGHRDYPGLGWAVVVRQDADKVLAPIRRFQWNLALLGLGAALAAAFVGSVLAKRITRPLLEIAEAADRIREYDHDARIPYARSYAEVFRLSSALVDLDARLRRRVSGRSKAPAA